MDDIKLLIADPAAARAKCESDRLEMMEGSADELFEMLSSLLSETDRAALTPELAEHMTESTQSGLAPGADGWWDDAVAEISPWAVELSDIRTPVLLRHGREDRFVPFGHGKWLARHIPGVQAELTEDDGHLTLTERHLDQVHAWLLERLG